ncbi:chemotaxis protein [Kiritimatiellota bacterium B12222]|nr:chemotaxis protein [Kiritimatiellota bacterium B12222]
MIVQILIASVTIFGLCGFWLWLQAVNRRYAKEHPELGRYREEGGECGKTCGCANWKHCMLKSEAQKQKTKPSEHTTP